jgi:glycerol-3-phosphate acyltransferase PlsX
VSSTETTVLALDAHGGDQGLAVSVPAALAAIKDDPGLEIILVGNESKLESALARSDAKDHLRLSILPATTVLAMDAKPVDVLRRGRESSLWKAFELVASQQASACVSSGNTSAMMTAGVKLLGTLPGIQRPALMAYAPSLGGRTGLLDLGANLKVSARQLVQFAVMGSVAAREVEGQQNPRVGLLNVGHEDSKGHDVVREAQAMLQDLPLNYAGFIEGHDIFGGKVDIAVCDGFAGNLVLKSAEGLARMFLKEIRDAFDANLASRLGGLLVAPSLRRMVARLDPAAHNGAPLLGLKSVAVKSHGGTDIAGLTRAILEAGREARRQVPRKIEASIHEYQLESSA